MLHQGNKRVLAATDAAAATVSARRGQDAKAGRQGRKGGREGWRLSGHGSAVGQRK